MADRTSHHFSVKAPQRLHERIIEIVDPEEVETKDGVLEMSLSDKPIDMLEEITGELDRLSADTTEKVAYVAWNAPCYEFLGSIIISSPGPDGATALFQGDCDASGQVLVTAQQLSAAKEKWQLSGEPVEALPSFYSKALGQDALRHFEECIIEAE